MRVLLSRVLTINCDGEIGKEDFSPLVLYQKAEVICEDDVSAANLYAFLPFPISVVLKSSLKSFLVWCG